MTSVTHLLRSVQPKSSAARRQSCRHFPSISRNERVYLFEGWTERAFLTIAPRAARRHLELRMRGRLVLVVR